MDTPKVGDKIRILMDCYENYGLYEGKEYIITCIEPYIGWASAQPVPNRFCFGFVHPYGRPEIDNGSVANWNFTIGKDVEWIPASKLPKNCKLAQRRSNV